MKKFWVSLVAFLFAIGINAQTVSSKLGENDVFFDGKPFNEEYGTVTIRQDAKLAKLADRYIKHNDARKGFRGWRVHLYFGSGYGAKEKAYRIRQQFKNLHPDIPVYVDYIAPNFKVSAGDFRRSEKNKAYKLKKSVEGKFPNSWIEASQVNYPRLYPKPKEETEEEEKEENE